MRHKNDQRPAVSNAAGNLKTKVKV